MNEPMQKEFDHYAKSYESDLVGSIPAAFSEGDFFALYKIQHIQRRIKDHAPHRILDFGCGVGISLSILKATFPKAELHGFDVSSKSVDLARKRVPGVHLTSVVDDLRSGSMDIILAANVLHHIPPDERVAALARCRRLLSDDGRLFIFEHNPLNPLTRFVFERCPFDREATMLRRSAAVELAISAELKVARSDYTLFFPKPLAALRPLERMMGRLPLGAQYCLELTR